MTTKVIELLFTILAAVVIISTSATAAPAVVPAFPSPVSDDEGATRTFSALAIDSGGIIPSNVSVFKNGSLVQYNESVPSGLEVDYTSVAVAGVWEINFTACNVEGCDSYIWVWTVNDTTAPSVMSNTNNVVVRNGSIVTLNATISDSGSGVKNATVNVSAINSTLNDVALTNTSGFWLFDMIADKATNGFEILQIVSYDNAGNVNNSVNMTVWSDGMPPGNVTNLTNNSNAQAYLNNTWVDPADFDLDHIEVYANDVFKQNVSRGIGFYNLTGLVANTQYNISVRPVDSVGNPGNWTNYSATTAPEPTIVTATPTPTPTPTTIDVTLSNVPIDFGSLSSGSLNQSASLPLNVTIESTTNVNVNLTLNGSDFISGSGTYSFGAGNLSYSNLLTGEKIGMNTSFPPPPFADWVNIQKLVKTDLSIYFWINVPVGQPAGAYNSTIYVRVEEYI